MSRTGYVQKNPCSGGAGWQSGTPSSYSTSGVRANPVSFIGEGSAESPYKVSFESAFKNV